VVEAGSFVGAADALGLSKAAVSRHVGELEGRLGVRLLQRTTRKLSLTEEGDVFYARCRELLGGVEEAEAEITSRSGQAQGALRVTVPVSFGILHLAEVWGRFKALHPKVTLDVTLADRVVDIVDEGFDLAIRIATLPDSTEASRRFGEQLREQSLRGILSEAQQLHRSEILQNSISRQGETHPDDITLRSAIWSGGRSDTIARSSSASSSRR